MRKLVIALVGRPNVGKSTLFNRLSGERLAVVDDTPGTTRDRLVAEAEWRGINFDIVDTGGIDPTHLGSATPLSIGSADYIEEIKVQAQQAARDADGIILLVDGESGLSPADHEVAGILRRNQGTRAEKPWPPIILAVNKCENEKRRSAAIEFYELGLGEPHPISALHGTGIGNLLDLLFEALQELIYVSEDEAEEEFAVNIAIVGRPNVGKSSLLNKLLGEERVIVSPIPGTTRDAIDTTLTYHGEKIRLIDTAGIRRRGKIEPGVEKYSVLRTLKAIERADVVTLLIDATEGVSAQDSHIAGMILDKMKSVIVIVNKWDAIQKDTETMHDFTQHVRLELNFLDYVPILFTSAKTGQRVGQVIPTALQIQEERLRRIPTSEINRVIRDALNAHAPPSKAGKRLKIYYGSQVRTDPPTFLFHVNDPRLVHFSYMRFLENRIRSKFGFIGTPLRLSFRQRSKSSAEKKRV
jgi:GTP-binding protein